MVVEATGLGKAGAGRLSELMSRTGRIAIIALGDQESAGVLRKVLEGAPGTPSETPSVIWASGVGRGLAQSLEPVGVT